MKRLLDIDSPIMHFFIRIFDCMILSVLWLVFSLPVVTMGAASTALYSAVYHHVVRNESYLWQSFWTPFKEEFKRSTLAWLPMLAMVLFLAYDIVALRLLIRQGNPLGRLLGVIVVLLFVSSVWAMYLSAYWARFQGGVKDVLRCSFYLMMAHPLRSIFVMASIFVEVLLILTIPGLAALLPAVTVWICSGMIEQVFAMHLRPEDAKKLKEEEEKS